MPTLFITSFTDKKVVCNNSDAFLSLCLFMYCSGVHPNSFLKRCRRCDSDMFALLANFFTVSVVGRFDSMISKTSLIRGSKRQLLRKHCYSYGRLRSRGTMNGCKEECVEFRTRALICLSQTLSQGE